MDPDLEMSLVGRLREGDTSAFDEVHSAFNARIFSFLLRLSRRRDVAEDLLEETWLRLVTHAGRLRPDTRLAPWLFTVARNLYISYQRSRLLEDVPAASFIGLWPFGQARPSPFEETAANEHERRIEAALASLPVAYREVLLLVGVEGFRPAEVAALCHISPEAVRQRLSRARALLARRLDGRGRRDARIERGDDMIPNDPLDDVLAGLPRTDSDPLRSGRVRAKCRARLARSRAAAVREPARP